MIGRPAISAKWYGKPSSRRPSGKFRSHAIRCSVTDLTGMFEPRFRSFATSSSLHFEAGGGAMGQDQFFNVGSGIGLTVCLKKWGRHPASQFLCCQSQAGSLIHEISTLSQAIIAAWRISAVVVSFAVAKLPWHRRLQQSADLGRWVASQSSLGPFQTVFRPFRFDAAACVGRRCSGGCQSTSSVRRLLVRCAQLFPSAKSLTATHLNDLSSSCRQFAKRPKLPPQTVARHSRPSCSGVESSILVSNTTDSIGFDFGCTRSRFVIDIAQQDSQHVRLSFQVHRAGTVANRIESSSRGRCQSCGRSL